MIANAKDDAKQDGFMGQAWRASPLNSRFSPAHIMTIAGATVIGLMVVNIAISASQPWLGVTLSADPLRQLVIVAAVDPEGPSAQLHVGHAITRIGDLALEPDDVIDEPDTLPTYAAFARLLERQARLQSLLARDTVTVATAGPSEETHIVTPWPRRPLWSFPLTFWSQIFAGACGLIIGVWVWSLRPADTSARLMAFAGVLLLTMIFPAAVYSSRELAIDAQLFRWLAALDHLGAVGYGVAMVALFYIYPQRLVPLPFLWSLPTVFGVWWVLDTAWLVFEGASVGFYLPSLLLMMLFVPAALLQYLRTRDDPAMRAALRWFALTVGVGSGTFVVLIVVPNLMGRPSLIAQAHAFLLFIIVFAGVAVGVARYRLFELDAWAFKILFYLAGVVLLVLLDAILTYMVALERIPAFSVSLLAVALVYLPLRDRIWRSLHLSQRPRGPLFQQVVDIVLSPPHVDQDQRWAALMKDVFDPLRIERWGGVATASIGEEGLVLLLPGTDRISPLRLGYAAGGRRLFSRADQALADDLCAMLRDATQSRHSRERGIAEERTRIMRDIHDNLGAKLLSALHSPTDDHKNAMIRESLSELRAIVNDATAGARHMDEILAEIRAETAERLEDAGLAMQWETYSGSELILRSVAAHTLRSVIREAVTNVIRHAEATRVDIRIEHEAEEVRVIVSDNGRGIDVEVAPTGRGLANIRARVRALGGRLSLDGAKPGTRLEIVFGTHSEGRP